MATLTSKSRQTILVPRLDLARSFFSRGVGLLGRASLGPDQALWIEPCSGGVHTWFMRFAIDCVFVDREGRILKIAHDVRPWRFVFPRGKARSVLELPAGAAKRLGLQVGEELHVGA